MARKLIHGGAVRYARHSDEFWVDLIAAWEVSGIGVRKFCEQNGVAPSTFHKRRQVLAATAPRAAPCLVVPETSFIAVHAGDVEVEQSAPLSVPAAKQQGARDSVVIQRAGMRIELTGAHAERIVRHLLGRLNGASC